MRLWPSISRCFFIAIADLHLVPRSSHTFWVNIIPYVPLLAKSFPRLSHQLHSRIRGSAAGDPMKRTASPKEHRISGWPAYLLWSQVATID